MTVEVVQAGLTEALVWAFGLLFVVYVVRVFV